MSIKEGASPSVGQADDVRWPAEWEPQTSTWIAWPHNRATWPGHFAPVPDVFVNFIEQLSRVQRVDVLSGPDGLTPSAAERLGGMANVVIRQLPTNDVWIRDYGPTFVQCTQTGRLIGVDWQYNAWGGKYPPFDRDAAAARHICNMLGCQCRSSTLVCEGGGLEGNGAGTLMTTSSVLLSRTRNPNWTRQQVEDELMRQLGVHKILWVDGGGLEGDDTDGHIDQLARFVSPNVVLAAVSSSTQDSNHSGLQENLLALQQSVTADAQPLEVIPLPTPLPRFVGQQRVPESYCNFLIANEIVIVPTFRSPTDEPALKLIDQLLPGRRIVPVDAYDLILGLGAFHCASQQQPQSTDSGPPQAPS